MKRAWNFVDRAGKRYGRLTAIELIIYPKKKKDTFWKCRCECGNETIVFSGHLNDGHTVSCGCFHNEQLSKSMRKHGHTTLDGKPRTTPEYRAWHGMRQRCKNKNSPRYSYYGQRGITVCERWDSFQNFLSDMGPNPSRKHSLERMDTNGNYEPSNCKWGTSLEQSNNRRNNRKLEFKGKTMNISQWAREIGLKPERIWDRINNGWTVERTLTTPIKK